MQRDSSQGTARQVMQQMSVAMHRKDYDAAQQLFDLELTQQVQSYINAAFGDLHWVINSMSLQSVSVCGSLHVDTTHITFGIAGCHGLPS